MLKVLFICPQFNGSEIDILNEMEKEYEVTSVIYSEHDIFSIRNFRLNVLRLFNVITSFMSISFIYRCREKYTLKYNKLGERLKLGSNFDIVFVIKGFGLNYETLKVLKKNNPNARFVFYQWDSFQIFHSTKSILHFFDDVYSFQREDITEHIKYLPNCHFNHMKKNITKVKPLGLVYIGRFSFYRYFLLKKISKYCQKNNFQYRFLLISDLGLLSNLKFVSKDRINKCKVAKLYRQYGIVLDIGQKYQSGVTQRFFEGLSIGCNVITTSTDIGSLNISSDYVLTLKEFQSGSRFNSVNMEMPDINEYGVKNWLHKILQ
ncbi:hypothetical protein [uncultured Psychromonas sp.]|uniref:hypothetical protein n=1 Tax=uncultured Psychromonas sp. TaxID=173974 RepID=UPI002631D1D0|nr:hypothetical protein [uncultured Psychromonas sp.]